MKKVNSKNENAPQKSPEDSGKPFPGYPAYPAEDDIYEQDKEVKSVNLEEMPDPGESNEKPKIVKRKNFGNDLIGGELDVPGSELDDGEENDGSEDEENNYYSIGGDNHSNLDEPKGD